MPFWQLFYHVVWATKRRDPILDDHAVEVVVRVVRTACLEQRVIVHAVGTMPDHVHVVASIPPAVAVATVVGRWKGSSSHLLNHAERRPDQPPFAWQAEYGVLSFGKRAFSTVVDYVQHQPARHAAGNLWAILEQTDDEKEGHSRLEPASST